MSDIWPDNITPADAQALDALAAAGVGEGDFDGDQHGVPADLVELYEVLEWQNAVADAAGEELPHPTVGVPPPNDPGVANSTPLVSRAGWGARPARSVTPRHLSMLTAHYGGPSPWGAGADRSTPERFAATTDHARCATIMRAYQAFHMDSRGWVDFAYSSGGCPHGVRYEGRGLDVRTAAQGTTIGNDTSHACCYLAGDGDPLTAGAKEAFADESRRLRGLTKGHRDWKQTKCPGDPLYEWVHSNQAVPGTPTTPPPVPPEDDDMFLLPLKGTPAHALVGPGYWHNLGQSEIDDAKAIGIPVKPAVDRARWDRSRAVFTAGAGTQASMQNAVAKVLEYAAAAGEGPLQEIVKDALAGGVDVDEAEVARLILAGFDPAKIAEAIPADLADKVADELGARLQG